MSTDIPADAQATEAHEDKTSQEMNTEGGGEQIDLSVDLSSIDDLDSLREVALGMQKAAKTNLGQKNHWREKHDKLANAGTERKGSEPAPAKKSAKTEFNEEELRESIAQSVREEVMLSSKYPDMTPEELARAKSLAKADGKSLLETVEDPYFQAYLEKGAEQRRSDQATPGASGRHGNGGSGFTVADLNDAEKIKQMPDDVYQKLSDQLASQTGGGNVIRI